MRLSCSLRTLVVGLVAACAFLGSVSAQSYPTNVYIDPATQLLLERQSTEIFAIAPLPDGRAYVAGRFDRVGGQTRPALVRLLADGSLDDTFPPFQTGFGQGSVTALHLQADGRLIVAGGFQIPGTSRQNLVRLNSDGSVDPSFGIQSIGGAAQQIRPLAEGRLLLVGQFSGISDATGQSFSRSNAVIITADGAVDPNFVPAATDGLISAGLALADGGYLIGGNFTTVGGVARKSLARLHADGSLDSSFPAAGGLNPSFYAPVYALEQQSTGGIIIAGNFTQYAGQSVTNLIRVDAAGNLDADFKTVLGSVNGEVWGMLREPDNSLWLTGGFSGTGGVTQPRLMKLLANGAVDTEMTAQVGDRVAYGRVIARGPDDTMWAGGNPIFPHSGGLVRFKGDDGAPIATALPLIRGLATVNASLRMADGSVWLGGDFTWVNGERADGLVRIGVDGSVAERADLGFTFAGQVTSLLNAGDGAFYIGGGFNIDFSRPGAAGNLVRRLADGTLDPDWALAYQNADYAGGVSGFVRELAALPNGDILVVGDFTSVQGQAKATMARLTAAGTLVPSFTLASGLSLQANAVRDVLSDDQGRVYVAGSFTTQGAETRRYLARLTATGELDTSFADPKFSGFVNDILWDAQGRLVAGGGFSSAGPTFVPRVARILASGVLDTTFNPSTANLGFDVSALVEQGDGKLLVAGSFTSSAHPLSSPYLVRLDAVGAIDATFTALNISGPLTTLDLRDDGSLVVGGNTANRANVGATAVATVPMILAQPQAVVGVAGGAAAFTVEAAGGEPLSYQWFRDGALLPGATGAELELTSLDYEDVGTYTVRVANVLGSVTSAAAVLSSGDAVPVITGQPQPQSIGAGLIGTLSVGVDGSGYSYQWRRQGEPLAGATGPSLILTHASMTDAGLYDVVVINGLSSVVSTQVPVRVNPLSQPGAIAADAANAAVLEIWAATVRQVVPLPDGRTYVAGAFMAYEGERTGPVVRLLADGSLDPTFRLTDIVGDEVTGLVVQADGKVVIGGNFSTRSGQGNSLLRLNPDGTIDPTFQSRGTNSNVTGLAAADDGRLLVGGYFSGIYNQNFVQIARPGFAVLTADGAVDLTVNPPTFSNVNSMVARSLPGGGFIVGGQFSVNAGTTTKALVRLQADGSLDATFAGGVGMNADSVPTVHDLAVLTDGSVIVAGQFATFNGQTVGNLIRISASGVLDETFQGNLGGVGGPVYQVEPEPDGSLVIVGLFSAVGGVERRRIARLNGDGSLAAVLPPAVLDTAAAPARALARNADGSLWLGVSSLGEADWNLGRLDPVTGENSGVAPRRFRRTGEAATSLLMPGNTMLVGGRFDAVDGQRSTGLVQLGPDGGVVRTFDLAPAHSLFTVYALLRQSDGSVIVGGTFFTNSQEPGFANYLVRLRPDGTLDPHFGPALREDGMAMQMNGGVLDLAEAPDGSFVAVGFFTSIDNQPRVYVARFDRQGNLDPSFAFNEPNLPFIAYRDVTIDPTGRIYLAGSFTTIGGTARSGVLRLLPDGTLDPAFVNPQTNGVVREVVLDDQGRLLIVGEFSSIAGVYAPRVARLLSDGTRDATFLTTGEVGFFPETILPQADGKLLVAGSFTTASGDSNSPYLVRLNADGTRDPTLVALGFGGTLFTLTQRDDGQLFAGGALSAVSGFTVAAFAPSISAQPVDALATTGGEVSFTVGAAGTGPLAYQWQFEGQPIAGATGATLTLADIGLADIGGYRVRVSNPLGSVLSEVAQLNPADVAPTIVQQPSDLLVNVGQAAGFSVIATPGGEVGYQWYRNGQPIAGATAATLDLAGVSLADAGHYRVHVINGLASAWSAVAELAVTPVALPGLLVADADGLLLERDYARVVVIHPLAGGGALVAGQIDVVDHARRALVVRLAADGALDDSFRVSSRLAGTLNSLAVQADGRIVIGGSLTVDGEARNIARLLSDGALDESFRGSLNSTVNSVAVLADGRIAAAGFFSSARSAAGTFVSRRYVIVLEADGTADESFVDPNLSGNATSLVVMPDGDLLVGGGFSTVGGVERRGLVKLGTDGGVDTTFAAAGGFDSSGFSQVFRLARLADDRIVAAGFFNNTPYAGTAVRHILVLNTDGSLDPVFSSAVSGISGVQMIAPDADGGAWLAGSFFTVAGQSRPGVARLNSNGVLDATFVPTTGVVPSSVASVAPMADGSVWVGGSNFSRGGLRLVRLSASAGASQANAFPALRTSGSALVARPLPGNELLVGGMFDFANGQAADGLARLDSAGVAEGIDLGFTGTGTVTGLVRQTDGGTVVAGSFGFTGGPGGPSGNNLLRLAPGGGIDPTFGPAAGVYTFSGSLNAMTEMSDGRLVLAGSLTLQQGGQARGNVVRLFPDGTIDWSLDVPGTTINGGQLQTIAVDEQARIYLGGTFNTVAGVSMARVARLLPSGAFDGSFANPNVNSSVFALVLDAQERLLVGGFFTQVGGVAQPAVARLLDTGARDPSFAPLTGLSGRASSFLVQTDGKVLVGGSFSSSTGNLSSPQVMRLNDDGSRDESFIVWQMGGEARALARRDDGALFAGGTAPAVNGVLLGGELPSINSAPLAQVVTQGDDVSFAVTAVGTGPLTYQWFHDNEPIAGATGPTLLLADVTGADRGVYAVEVRNGFGAVRSAPVTLAGAEPVPDILVQPQSQFATAGDTVELSVQLSVSDASYQWRRNGEAIAGATGTTLTLPAVGMAASDVYDVLIAHGASLSELVSHLARVIVLPTTAPGISLPDPSWNLEIAGGRSTVLRRVFPSTDGRVLVTGSFNRVDGHATRNAMTLLANGTVDDQFALPSSALTGRMNPYLVQPYGAVQFLAPTTRSGLVEGDPTVLRFDASGVLDETLVLDPALGVAFPNFNINQVRADAVGRILLGLAWSEQESAGPVSRYALVRLTATGEWDRSFATVRADNLVQSMVALADGSLAIAGVFAEINGEVRNKLARVSATGVLLAGGFAAGSIPETMQSASVLLGSGAEFWVSLQSTGTNGAAVFQLNRYAQDGTLTRTWTAGGWIWGVIAAGDGAHYAFGTFSTLGETPANRVARLLADGSVDDGFLAPTGLSVEGAALEAVSNTLFLHAYDDALPGYVVHRVNAETGASLGRVNLDLEAPGEVRAIQPLVDGTWLLGGDFSRVNGEDSVGLVVVNAAGEIVTTFDPAVNGPDGSVYALRPMGNGGLLVTGLFQTYAGEPVFRFARLHADLSLDSGFVLDSRISAGGEMAAFPLPDGDVLVSGWWLYYDNSISNRRTYALLDNAGKVIESRPFPMNGSPAVSAMVFENRDLLVGGFSPTTRLSADGAFDTDYNSNLDLTVGIVLALAPSVDGSYWAAGFSGVERVLADGRVDPATRPGLWLGSGFTGLDNPNTEIRFATANEVMISGHFGAGLEDLKLTSPILRLHTDRSVDSSFFLQGVTEQVTASALTADGRMLVATPGRVFRTMPAPAAAPVVAEVSDDIQADEGDEVVLRALAFGDGTLSYVWRKNGVLVPDAGGPELDLGEVTAADAGTYQVFVTNAQGTTPGAEVVVAVEPYVPPSNALVSLSAPVDLAPGEHAYAPFRIQGTGSKLVLLRAVGPTLAGFGVETAMDNPRLRLLDASGQQLLANDDWSSTSENTALVADTSGAVGAFALGADSADAATVVLLPPGRYILDVSGVGSGRVMVEIFDADAATHESRFVHLGLAGRVPDTGALPVGFVVDALEPEARSIMFRAVSESLTLPDALADSVLTLYQGATAIGSSDDWGGQSFLSARFEEVGAAGWSAGSRDSAFEETLANGVYRLDLSAQGAAGGGMGLVEIYDTAEIMTPTGLFLLVPPQDQAIHIGEAVTLGVHAGGAPGLTYQWLLDGEVINGATQPTLEIVAAELADAGDYTVVVTAGETSLTSAPAMVTVTEPPVAPTMLAQPLDTTIASGGTATLWVEATGTGPLSYQWYEGVSGNRSMPIEGATSSTYSTSPLSATTSFWASVSNDFGEAFSDTATVTVLPDSPNYGTHAVVGGGYVPGQRVTVTTSFTYEGALGSLGWSVQLPEGWSFVSTNGEERPDVRPQAGDTGLVGWGYTSLPLSPVSFSYTILAPAEQTGVVSLAGVVLFTPSGQTAQQIVLTPGPLQLEQRPARHAADFNQDGRLDLSELLRVIALYNTRFGTVRTGRYRLAEGTEDGFNADATLDGNASITLNRYHSADVDRDGKIGLSELLRVIELYNTRSGTTRTGEYHLDPTTEDGFASGPTD